MKLRITINRYLIQCTRRVSGITFFRYAQSRKIGKPTNLKLLGCKQTKGPKHDSQNPLNPSSINKILTIGIYFYRVCGWSTVYYTVYLITYVKYHCSFVFINSFQCVGGFLRPGPKSQYRPYFNWGHLAMGLGSYIFGGQLRMQTITLTVVVATIAWYIEFN